MVRPRFPLLLPPILSPNLVHSPPISTTQTTPKSNPTTGFTRLGSAELKAFCENMDGLGLRNYIVKRRNERATIRVKLLDALRLTPDSVAMVLDTMEGFCVKKSRVYD
ncbi:FRIGIDA-like protein 2 [Camellia lanceoleosa]|uniref:FRIGIDA-like protein 2 n=1 Tax=Camellia lanceoleosa TaxID=1840588 RepID=A0ACC0FYG6_9ERIC|nr:FRIGIDA-like protein 2 [Camellia lanceoleosa]